MKIKRIKVWKENLLLTKPYTIAVHTIDSAENAFVYIELENGVGGIGAASPAEFVTGENMDHTMLGLEQKAAELLLGKDIRTFQAIIRESNKQLWAQPAARAAIDIALHDAFTKNLGIPLLQYLGQVHKGLPTSVTIGIKSLEETLEEAAENVQKGFKVIKLKTGLDVEADVAIFAKLREKVGSEIKIRVDANQSYNADDLVQFVKRTQHLNVELIEQPFPPKDREQMRLQPADIRSICMADEDLHSPADAVALAAHPQPYGLFNIKLMKCGGVSQGIKIAEVAEHAGIQLMWGCMDESIVSITAALCAALASPATHYLDLDGSFDIAKDIVRGGFILQDGCLYPNDAPGLGVELIENPF